MKPCTGCKHLVHARGQDVCRAEDGPWTTVMNPYTGRSTRETLSKHGWWRPTVGKMRDADGSCGPDARLYAPNWWRLLVNRLRTS